MYKLLSLFVMMAFIACNNADTNTAAKDSLPTIDTPQVHYFTWTKQEEGEFLSGCVDSAKVKLGETAAYRYCNCVLRQLRQKFPSMDSAATMLIDGNKAEEYAKLCK